MHSRKVVEFSTRFKAGRAAGSDARSRALDMGAQARRNCRSKASCPFAHGVARREWMRGYNEG